MGQGKKSVDSVVKHWIKKGFPPSKILLGISLWERSWKLSSDETTPPAPADGPGSPRNYTNKRGFLSYFEICQDVKNLDWQVIQDQNRTMGPYVFLKIESHQENCWISYDDPAMVKIKAEYIISKAKGLAGAAVKDMSYDDFQNKCDEGKKPMLSALRNSLTPGWNNSSATLTSVVTLISAESMFINISITLSILSSFLFLLLLLLPKYFERSL